MIMKMTSNRHGDSGRDGDTTVGLPLGEDSIFIQKTLMKAPGTLDTRAFTLPMETLQNMLTHQRNFSRSSVWASGEPELVYMAM